LRECQPPAIVRFFQVLEMGSTDTLRNKDAEAFFVVAHANVDLKEYVIGPNTMLR
jgi:hypothetical protein